MSDRCRRCGGFKEGHPKGLCRAYAGNLSSAFWRRVNKLPEPQQDYLFGRGVALQNLERDVLRELWLAESVRVPRGQSGEES